MTPCPAVRTGARRRRALPSTCLALLALAAVALAVACTGRAPTVEERAVALDRQIMCPICDGQTLDESRSGLAGQMRQVIREKLAAGEDEEQIRAYFSDPGRYGVIVLASPPASGFNLALWILPPVAALVGAGTLFLIVWHRRRAAETAAAPLEAERDLSPYLEQVDRELGLKSKALPGADTAGSGKKG